MGICGERMYPLGKVSTESQWYPALRRTFSDPGVQTLVWFPPPLTLKRAALCNKILMRWDIHGWVIREMTALVLLFLGSFFPQEASHHIVRTLTQPEGGVHTGRE